MKELLIELKNLLAGAFKSAEDALNGIFTKASDAGLKENFIAKEQFIGLLNTSKVLERYHNIISGIKEPVEKLIAELQTQMSLAKEKWQEVNDRINGSVSVYNLQAEASKREHDAKIRPLKETISSTEAALKAEKTHLSRLHQSLYGTDVPHRPKKWRKILLWIGLTIVALAEMPVNYPVFQMFAENAIVTMTGAITFGIAIAMVSHFVGANLKKTDGTKFGSFAFIVAMIVVAYVAGYFRSEYLQTLQNSNAASSVSQPIMLGVFNILFFFAGVALTYGMSSRFSHEKEQAYLTQWDKVAGLEKELGAVSASISVIEKNYTDELAGIRSKVEHDQTEAGRELPTLNRLRKELEDAESALKEAQNLLEKFFRNMDKLFQEEMVSNQRILKELQGDDYKAVQVPSLRSAEFWQRTEEVGRYE